MDLVQILITWWEMEVGRTFDPWQTGWFHEEVADCQTAWVAVPALQILAYANPATVAIASYGMTYDDANRTYVIC
jgi:hypothetical protein